MNLLSGTLSLILAKVVFVVSGYALYSALSRLLDPSEFGVFLVVNSVVAVLNAIFITGTVQTVSKLVSAGTHDASAVRAAFRLQLAVAGTAVLLYFLGAGFLAGFLNDRSLAWLIRISAVIPLSYAFYAVFVGYLNGRRLFGRQALFDVGFSVIKPSLIIAGVLLGFGAAGAIGGFALGSVVIVVAAAVVVRTRPDAQEAPPLATLLKFQTGVMAYVGVSNLLMQSDVMMMKALSPAETANASVALYGSALKLAQVPYSLLVALNFVVFPLFARAVTERDPRVASEQAGWGVYACLALVAGPVAILAATSEAAMALVFGDAYRSGGEPLAILLVGYGALSLLGLILTMVNSAGSPYVSLGVGVSTLALQVALNSALIPRLGVVGAAIGTTIALCCGCAMAAAYLRRRFGAAMPIRRLVAVVGSAALVYLAGRVADVDGMMVLLVAASLALVYLVLLAVTGGVTRAELNGLLNRPAPQRT